MTIEEIQALVDQLERDAKIIIKSLATKDAEISRLRETLEEVRKRFATITDRGRVSDDWTDAHTAVILLDKALAQPDDKEQGKSHE